MTFFENTIKKKDLKITKRKDLLKLFHPDKCLATEEKEKVNILRDHFSMVFFPNEKMEIKNLEDYELIDLEKLLKVYQNLQIATLLTLTIAKAMVFRLCVTKFKRLETKILGVFLSSILLDSINAPLLANKEYIYTTLKQNKANILISSTINILLWNYFIKENLNKVYCKTLATLIRHILLIPTYRNILQYYQNSFIANKILDLFFQKKDSNKNLYKEYNTGNQQLAIRN